jgi:hypothetical protein
MLGCDQGQQGIGLDTGLVMMTECDQTAKTAEDHDQSGLNAAGDLPQMTPETARRMAAILAPHLVAMRAVTSGTRYAGEGDEVCDGGPVPSVSPAIKIFIAGMLERIPA